MGIVLKEGVRLHDLSPQVVLGIQIAESEYTRSGRDLVVTSVNDGKHSVHSLHAIGHAVDLRTKNLPLTDRGKSAFALRIWTALGGVRGQFDVVYEGAGTPNEHIHVEYQPHKGSGEK